MSERYVLLLRESDPRIAPDACASQEHALRHEVAARGGRVVAVAADLCRPATAGTPRWYAHQYTPPSAYHPRDALGPDELISQQGSRYELDMTYRNLLLGVRYHGYDTAPPSGAQGPDLGPIALITDYAAQVLVRTRAYARSHTHDRWPASPTQG
jgi:hypothetical protein